jgi:hypothetical protein
MKYVFKHGTGFVTPQSKLLSHLPLSPPAHSVRAAPRRRAHPERLAAESGDGAAAEAQGGAQHPERVARREGPPGGGPACGFEGPFWNPCWISRTVLKPPLNVKYPVQTPVEL